jgi:hypothetical protein
VQRAERLFERLTGYANDLGLIAEEVDSATGELLGNFPQAFSHVRLITAACEIDAAPGREGGARCANPLLARTNARPSARARLRVATLPVSRETSGSAGSAEAPEPFDGAVGSDVGQMCRPSPGGRNE